MENSKELEESWPQAALYARALRHRISTREPYADQKRLDAARSWVTQMGRFEDLPDFASVDPVSEFYFRTRLHVAHTLVRLAARNPKDFSLQDVHNQLDRHERLANDFGMVTWLIEIWILRALMYRAEEKAGKAEDMIEKTLSVAAPRGFFRIFLDEGELMRSLLESVVPHLKDGEVVAYTKRLLDAMPGKSQKVMPEASTDEILSEREVEVLRLLAAGESYKAIGQKLFLSLNTVQFHIKSIYRKLLVNKRIQAVEKAREMNLF